MSKQKTLDDCFRDWENQYFGYGYGTGEIHILESIKTFLDLCTDQKVKGSYLYDYNEIEAELGGSTAWLLINIFGRENIIEYGSSTRYAWLTPKGTYLKKYLSKRSVSELIHILNSNPRTGDICTFEYSNPYNTKCECDNYGNLRCNNPFFVDCLDFDAHKEINSDPRWDLL